MLTNEELMKSWETDCKIDRSDLLSVMYSHPILHSKYLTYLQDYKLNLRKYTLKYQSTRLMRQRYFNGEMTREELAINGLQQYLGKRPMKSEMETLLDASSDLQIIEEKSLYIQGLIDATDSIMKDINSRYFLFKNLVEFTKFEAGV